MSRSIAKRLALATCCLSASIVAAPAQACPLTDYLFGRTPAAPAYAPAYGTPYAAGYAPTTLPLATGFQSPYTAGYAPSYGGVSTADPVATTLSLRRPPLITPTTISPPANYGYNAYRPFYGTQSAYAAARPAYIDNPSVYTGAPVAGYTSNLRGTAGAASIGASNTYPTTGYGNPNYVAGYSGNAGVIGGPLTGGTVTGTPAYALPATGYAPAAPAPTGLGRFFGSVFGSGYRGTTYDAPVTYYRPQVSYSGVGNSPTVVQAGCTGSESLATQIPVNGYTPAYDNGVSQASFDAVDPNDGWSVVNSVPVANDFAPSATLPPNAGSYAPADQRGYELQTPLSRSSAGQVAPQYGSNSDDPRLDLQPVEQPRMQARRVAPSEQWRRVEPEPTREPSRRESSEYQTYRGPIDNDRDYRDDRDRYESDDDADRMDDYWKLQDADDSTAMLGRGRSREASSYVTTGRSAQPIRGIEPAERPSTRPVDRRRLSAPPLPARSSATRRRSENVRAYEIGYTAEPRLPAPTRTPVQTSVPAPVKRDSAWKPVR